MKKLLKNYAMGFEAWGLVLFGAIMLPNILWMLFPSPNDVIQVESVTPTIDQLGSVCQVLMVFCPCFLRRTDAPQLRLSPVLWSVIACVAVYWAPWGCYGAGMTVSPVLLAMTLVPCAAFLLFLMDRRNWIGLMPAGLFTLCHILFAVLNGLI